MTEHRATVHQASCVAIGRRAVLIEGPPGAGKSGLALALIDRGAELIGDDGVLLVAESDRCLARPHPDTRGLLEVRNLGLLPFPVRDEAPVALVIALDEAAPRFIDAAEACERAGIRLPMVRMWPDPSPHKAELALAHYGLPID